MISKITSKYQITIPKRIRNKLKLRISDTIKWKIENEKVVIELSNKPFLKHKARIDVGPGDTKEDIRKAREARANTYK